MKVLKNNYEVNKELNSKQYEPYPRLCVCEECLSELEYEESDLTMGYLGCAYLECPLCGCVNMMEDNEHTITLTKDNIEFPVHFTHCCEENGAINVFTKENIKTYINQAIDYFRKNKNEDDYIIETGNLHMVVFRCDSDDKEYYVVTTNNYYSTYIPFEKEDY